MPSRRLLFALLLNIIHRLPSTSAAPVGNLTDSALDATVFSLIVGHGFKPYITEDSFANCEQYGFPFAYWKKSVVALLQISEPNSFYFQRSFATPAFSYAPSPNVDTLYGVVVIDLSQHDLVITIPPLDVGRYWNFAFTDPYGNNFANIGSVTGSSSGNFLVRRAMTIDERRFRCSSNNESAYEGFIDSHTAYAVLNTDDLEMVRYLQNATSIRIQRRSTAYPNSSVVPKLSLELLTTTKTFPDAIAQDLELLARIVPHNPPIVASDTQRVYSNLASAGLYKGHYHPQATVNLAAAYSEAAAAIQATALDLRNTLDLGNDWYTDALDLAGNFGTNYAYRAYIATSLLLELVPAQALYPRPHGYYDQNFTLVANHSLLFSFSDIPPVRAGGFWSLTAYNGDYELIPNEIDRYNLGSRNTLTFQDGTSSRPVPEFDSLSGPRPFQILLQAADVSPPANWTQK
jgi:hypothetical protein